MSTSQQLAFIDLSAQRRRLGDRIDKRIAAVLEHGGYIMGPEVRELERELGEFVGATHVISCANGTDALQLALMAWGIGAGDAVLVPTFTFASTAEVVALVGATPVFVDVDAETYNIDIASLERGVATAVQRGLRPRAVIPVDLFGLPADHDAVARVAEQAGLLVLDDAAQGFGGTYRGRRVGGLADVTTTSFFPAKPLGCYGDGGAVLTDDADVAATLRSLRVHGQGIDKYDNVRIGMNGRLDTLQAAVLLEKLSIYEDEIEARQRVAGRYSDALEDLVTVPVVPEGLVSVWAQYTVQVPGRDRVAAELKQAGIPTAVYYPRPLHQQTAYRDFPVADGGMPVAERLAARVLSLPMHPYLARADQDRVVTALRASLS